MAILGWYSCISPICKEKVSIYVFVPCIMDLSYFRLFKKFKIFLHTL